MLFLLLLIVHVSAGATALGTALVAMASRKQAGQLHARAGTWFVWTMSAMALTGAVLTAWEPDPLTLGAALWTLSLIHTARLAARRRDGTLDRAGLLASLPAVAALGVLVHGMVQAIGAPDQRYLGTDLAGYGVFAFFTALSLLFDVSLLWRSALAPRARIARHLWRMTMACFLAVTSLFLGQQDDVFPFMQGSPLLLIPSLLTIGFLGFWIVRVRFARNWLGLRRAAGPVSASSVPTH